MQCLVELFCSIDDFWKTFKSDWDMHLINNQRSRRGPQPELTISEMMTIVVLFHQSGYRTFKHFYTHLEKHFRCEFPKLISYSRFVKLMKSLFVPLFAYLLYIRGSITGISFVDSTSIKVCTNKRISRNKVFKGFAKLGKTTTSWFYGFKLHLIINDMGEILAFQLTPGNIADVSMLETLSGGLWGKLFGDKGYISSKMAEKLFSQGVHLITGLRAKMKQKLLPIMDKIMLRKRSLIETVNDQLKNISQVEHSRHRSPANFLINLLSGLVAYMHQPKKPALKMQNFSEAFSVVA
jgi:hypothetical protein